MKRTLVVIAVILMIGIAVLAQPPTPTPNVFLPFLSLSATGANATAGTIINVTVYRNCAQRALVSGNPSVVVDSFMVDKKSANSDLLIEGVYNASQPSLSSPAYFGEWDYALTVTTGQAGPTTPGEHSTFALLTGAVVSGQQLLTFRFTTNDPAIVGTPFQIYNPAIYPSGKNCSIYTVYEIE